MKRTVEFVTFLITFFLVITLWDHFFLDSINWISNIIMTVIASIIYMLFNYFIKKKSKK